MTDAGIINLSGLSILIVEDSISLVSKLELMLADRGMVVETAGSIETAKSLLFEGKNFDFALVDMYLPEKEGGKDDRGMRGEKLCYDIRRHSKDVIIIGMSSNLERQPFTPISNLWARFFFKEDIFSSSSGDDFFQILEGSYVNKRKRIPRNFIVHGHDDNLLMQLIGLLQNDLHFPAPTILQHESNLGLTIIEKFERVSSNVDMIFVLMTPDDEVTDKDGNSYYRARPNVVFELGYFYAKFRRDSGKINLLVSGDVEIPSDISGVEYYDVSDGVQKISEKLRKKFQTMGYSIPG